jgi:hypothetical protein
MLFSHAYYRPLGSVEALRHLLRGSRAACRIGPDFGRASVAVRVCICSDQGGALRMRAILAGHPKLIDIRRTTETCRPYDGRLVKL